MPEAEWFCSGTADKADLGQHAEALAAGEEARILGIRGETVEDHDSI